MTADLDHSHSPELWDDVVVLPVAGADIASAAARVGHQVWLSSRLFEITGRWSRQAREPSLVIGFASVSTRFAWQAAEWRRRLPRLREVDEASLIRPPAARTATALDELAATVTDERPAILADLVARLRGYYDSIAADSSPLRDGPVLRTLARIQADLQAMDAEISDIRHTVGRTDVTTLEGGGY